MGIQQLFIGASPPLSALASPPAASGDVFLIEPAPASTNVFSNVVTVLASGGTGSYTYSWAYLSGSAVPGIISAASSASQQWDGVVPKNTSADAMWRCTVSDGVSNVTVDVLVGLSYSTNL